MTARKRDVEAFLSQLWALEATLVKAGFPPMPEWWRREIARFYRSGKRRWVIRKGRRVFASSCVAVRLACAEMLFGKHLHLPGTPPLIYAFLSVKRDEASKRIRGVKAILDVLGEAYTERGETIELTARPAIFSVLTANFRLSVGDTVAFAWCDEVSRWNDDAVSANPAEQVIGSLAPALATLPDAKLFLVSSPLGIEDYHAKSFDLGETPAQCVSFGETWTINPTLSKEATLELEPDEKLWRREYAAIPSATSSPAFEHEHVLRCRRAVPQESRFHQFLGSLDSAAGRKASSDSMAWAVIAYAVPPPPPPYLTGMVPRLVSQRDPVTGQTIHVPSKDDFIPGILTDDDGRPHVNPEALRPAMPLLVLRDIDSVSGVFQHELVSGGLWQRIGNWFRAYGAQTVVGDRYGEPQSKRELLPYGIDFRGVDWPNDAKVRAVYRLRQLMADRALILPPHERLISELLAYNERIEPSGTIKYAARGSGKDDHVAVLINAMIAEEERLLPGSDLYAPNVRHEAPGR